MAPLLHPVSEGVRPQPIHFSKDSLSRTLAEDREIIERIIAGYHKAMESASPDIKKAMCSTIWGAEGLVGMQGEFIRALEDQSAADVHEILSQYFISDAAYGIAMGRQEMEIVEQKPEHRRHYGLMWLDRLVGLAQALGVVSIPNPEDSNERWQKSLEVDPEQLFAAIEERIGIKLDFPNIGGVFGGEIRGRAFPFIAFTHLLVALSVRPLALHRNPNIFEIGGGFGGLAYWVAQLLPCRYTIFDLAFTNAVQAYFLHRALPDKKLVLCGEPADQAAALTLLPAWALFAQPAGTVADLVVNQDSMPEFPQKTACQYLQAMKGFLRGPFLSVNQEPAPEASQMWDRTSVMNLIGKVGGYVRMSRSPFFLRMGYVQEVYFPAELESVNSLPEATPWNVPVPPPELSNGRFAGQWIRPMKTAYNLLRQGEFQEFKVRMRKRVGQRMRSFMW